MSFALIWLLIGLWTYAVMATARLHMFRKGATAGAWWRRQKLLGIVKGLAITLVAWPTIPVLMYLLDKSERWDAAAKRRDQRYKQRLSSNRKKRLKDSTKTTDKDL